MEQNSHQNSTLTSVMKFVVAGVVVLILVLAAFGAGVGIGVGQGRSMAAAPAFAAPAERAEQSSSPASEQATSASVVVQAAASTPTPAEQSTALGSTSPAAKTTVAAGVTPSPTIVQPTLTPQDKSKLPDQAPIDTALLNEAWKLLKEQYYGNMPTGEDVTYAAIRGIVSSLGDKHTAFLDPKQAEMFNTDIEGHFEGIGAMVDTADGGGVKIQHLFADQPAQKAGLQDGDVIIKVDGKDVTTLDLNDAVALIRGPRGTKVTLTIKRDDPGAVRRANYPGANRDPRGNDQDVG